MGEKKNWVRRFTVVEAALSLVQSTGIGTIAWYASSIIGSFGLTVAAYIWSELPWWALGMLFVCVSAIAAWGVSKGSAAYRDFTVARAMNKFDPSQYEKFGNELVALASEIFRFLADRQRDMTDTHKKFPVNSPDYDSWQADRDFEHVTGRLFFEKFGPQVLGSLALLDRIGIKAPSHIVTSALYRPNGLPQFLGLMGDLLVRGNIDDAVSVSQNRDFIWQIQH